MKNLIKTTLLLICLISCTFAGLAQTPAPGDAVPCPNTPTVTDYDGNTYNTVNIGKQCWMKENLRTTHYADGKSIRQLKLKPREKGFDFPNGDPANKEGYGLLYTIETALRQKPSKNSDRIQGVCPNGWHLPNVAEMNEFFSYVSSHPQYICDSSAYIGKALSATIGWKQDTMQCAPGNEPELNNTTGFNVLPVSNYLSIDKEDDDPDFLYGNIKAAFWGADCNIYYNGREPFVEEYTLSMEDSILEEWLRLMRLSVRCLKD